MNSSKWTAWSRAVFTGCAAAGQNDHRAEAVELSLYGLSGWAFPDRPEFTIIGDKNESITIEVLRRLLASCRLPCLVGKRLDLDDAALWHLALAWLWLAL
jgi:hypothetical protein